MNTKHTPGPWIYKFNKTREKYKIDGLRWEGFARVYAHTRDTITGKITDQEEGEANARLIAAAPELLEALRKTKDGILAMPSSENDHINNWLDNLVCIINAAIKKATE